MKKNSEWVFVYPSVALFSSLAILLHICGMMLFVESGHRLSWIHLLFVSVRWRCEIYRFLNSKQNPSDWHILVGDEVMTAEHTITNTVLQRFNGEGKCTQVGEKKYVLKP